ncbi:MAG: hypothetical protein U1E05_13660, partial [Patescibacteria group bacterium]|nr:hypothetical protein [Patescibacteria group bacterium]
RWVVNTFHESSTAGGKGGCNTCRFAESGGEPAEAIWIEPDARIAATMVRWNARRKDWGVRVAVPLVRMGYLRFSGPK